MFAFRNQHIPNSNINNNNDNISSDDSILDMNNTNVSNYDIDNDEYNDDNIPLLQNNNTNSSNTSNTRQNRDRRNNNGRNTNQNQNQNQNHGLIIQSPIYRNYLIKKNIWNVLIITLFASAGLAFVICGFNETINIKNKNIFNIDIQYLFYYFNILLAFYSFYIGINILTINISFLASINGNIATKILLLNGTIFQLNLIIRLFIMVILCVKIIENTPMFILNITNPGVVSNNMVNVYLPKYIQYMIIEIIIYCCLSYVIGFNNGIIRLL